MVRSAQVVEVHIRVGIHTGEVDISGGDARGIAVHTAARILAVAGPDEVLMSSTTAELLEGAGLDLEDAGTHELKGITGARRYLPPHALGGVATGAIARHSRPRCDRARPGRRGYHGAPVAIAPNDFTHLHVHSEFSLLDGLGRINDLVGRGVGLGFDIAGHHRPRRDVRRHRLLPGLQDAGIKPIIGVEIYVARRSMTAARGARTPSPTTSSCWRRTDRLPQPVKLVTVAHMDGFYYKPRIDRDFLAEHAKGSSACPAVSRARSPGRCERRTGSARAIGGAYRDMLGPDSFFLELQDHGMPDQHRLNEKLLRLGPGVRPAPGRHQRPALRPQARARGPRRAAVHLHDGRCVNDPNRMRFDSQEYYLKTPEEMAAFADLPEALASTGASPRWSTSSSTSRTLRLPSTPVPDGLSVQTCTRGMRATACVGATARSPTRSRRAENELSVIIQTGYLGYFLIVGDFYNFARKQGIAATGRAAPPGASCPTPWASRRSTRSTTS